MRFLSARRPGRHDHPRRLDRRADAPARAGGRRAAGRDKPAGMIDRVAGVRQRDRALRSALASSAATSPYDRMVATLGELLGDVDDEALPPARVVEIPVCYGGELGPDIARRREPARSDATTRSIAHSHRRRLSRVHGRVHAGLCVSRRARSARSRRRGAARRGRPFPPARSASADSRPACIRSCRRAAGI